MVRAALDTNLLVYAANFSAGEPQAEKARDLLLAISVEQLVVPAQVLGELARVLTGKMRIPVSQVQPAVETWTQKVDVPPTTADSLRSALDLVAQHCLQFWDAVILAVAAEAGCDLLLSEDYHHGFAWRGVTVINPFTHPDHPLIRRLTERRA